MKAKIYVTGGISSIHHISNALGGHPIECGKGMFYSKWFVYNSVKEAQEAIKTAGKILKEDGDPNYRKSKDNNWITYDAAKGEILKISNYEYKHQIK